MLMLTFFDDRRQGLHFGMKKLLLLSYRGACGESPLGDFCTLRLEESPEEKVSTFDVPPRRDDWNQAHGTVQSQTRYIWALTYGPDPSLYMTRQPPQDLPWKRLFQQFCCGSYIYLYEPMGQILFIVQVCANLRVDFFSFIGELSVYSCFPFYTLVPCS